MIKFEDLKNDLKLKLKAVYYLSGVDEFLLSSAYKMILKFANIEYEDLNLIKFSEGIIDCNDVIRALDTMPVFSNKKIVYLDIRMSKKTEIKNIKLLNDYMLNPNTSSILIINSGSNDDDFGVDKKLVEVVDCNRLDLKFVEAKINSVLKSKNKVIDKLALNLLIEYCLCDMGKIMIECDKLVSYIGNKDNIEVQDIKDIVTRSLEYQIFELTDALSKKNSKKVYEIINDMKSKKDEFKTLHSLIFAHFRRLFHISLNSSLSNLELSKLLGVKEFAIKMSQNQIKLFSKSGLKKINDLCASIDYDIKQSNISIENAIELLILNILNL